MSSKIKRAEELIDLINYHDKLYFVENRQEISDDTYDELWFELKELLKDESVRNAATKLKMPLGQQTSFLDKVTHLVPILSLDKVKSKDDSFEKNIRKFENKYDTGQGYLIESKLDGLTVVMYKQNGVATFATRGGSNKGENVTHQMMKIEHVREAAENAPDGMIVRGEAILRKSKFVQSEKYSNARNAVSGALRSKDETSFIDLEPEFVTYDILSHHSEDEIKDLQTLSCLGFRTVKCQVVTNEQDLFEMIESCINSDWREQEMFELDGLVIKPISKRSVEYDGDGHHAKGQIAVKFPPKGDVTHLRDVEFTIGKDGRMTPVAIYDTISIDGVKMNRASVGSWSNFKKLNVKIGDKIFVVRSNDVIPQIDAVLERYYNSKEVIQPKDTWIEGAHLYTEVSEPIEDKIAKSASALKIKAFNSRSYKILLEAGLIEEFHDLFSLKDKKEAMLQVKGLGAKKVESLLNEIELARRASFEEFLNSVQLLHVGKKNCKEISERCSTLQEFYLLDIDSLKSVNVRSIESLKNAQKDEDVRNVLEKVYNELDLPE